MPHALTGNDKTDVRLQITPIVLTGIRTTLIELT